MVVINSPRDCPSFIYLYVRSFLATGIIGTVLITQNPFSGGWVKVVGFVYYY
jgi:hypothetical protein